MTPDQIVQHISKIPDAMKMGDVSYWTTVVNGLLPAVTDEIAMAYDWDFVFNKITVTVTNLTATYTITGANFDVGDIQDIRYGTGKTYLQRMRKLDALDYIADNEPSDAILWYQDGVNKAGHPVIVIAGTPDESTTMDVRYRRTGVAATDFPPRFGLLFVSRILAEVSPERMAAYQNTLKRYIKRYHPGGKDYNVMQGDPQIIASNRNIHDLYGTG